jgi:hypothetical protein
VKDGWGFDVQHQDSAIMVRVCDLQRQDKPELRAIDDVVCGVQVALRKLLPRHTVHITAWNLTCTECQIPTWESLVAHNAGCDHHHLTKNCEAPPEGLL